MRPLEKGSVPVNQDGSPIEPTDYKLWRKFLIERIGYYCVYCNQPLSHNIQVEHVVPQNPPPGYEKGDPLSWGNLLLACGPCNLAKSNHPVNSSLFYLPEDHNTHLPFEIKSVKDSNQHAVVAMRNGLTQSQLQKARATIELLDLDNIDERDNIVDIRSLKRMGAIRTVRSAKELFEMAKQSPTYNPEIAANTIAYQAATTGFFSLWYDAFKDEALVMKKLIDNDIIKGTAQSCFDTANGYEPVYRNPHNQVDPI